MNNKETDKLNEIISGFDTAMLVTVTDAATMRARPMAVARHNEASGALWFSTSVDTEKVDELTEHPEAAITLQGKTQYVSLTGKAEIQNDRALIEQLFNESWKLWYPEGPSQKSIRLIKFQPSQGEYWDMSGTQGLKFIWQAGKALISDSAVDVEEGKQHGRAVL